MPHKLIYSLLFLVLIASIGRAQSRSMYVGDVELRLGMSRDLVMKTLTDKYQVTASGTSFIIRKYNQATKLHDVLGLVAFEKDQLTFISRSLDTSAWPADEGFSVGRAIYDGLSGAIARTDGDGAKRANARIVISSVDGISNQRPVNIRSIDIYIEDRKFTVIISDSPDGKRVDAQVDIRSKPW